LLYPVAAGAEAVFAIMVALLEWRRSGGWRMSIGALALGVVLPLVEGWLVFGLAPEEVFASLLPMTQIHLMGHPPGLVPFGALYCLLPALGLGALARDAWRRWRSRKTCADPQEKPVSQLKIRPAESKKLRRKLKQAGKTQSQGAHHFDWVWRGGWIAQMFRAIQAGLAEAGMEMKHVARTWFYLDDILAWYGDFNRVRNDFFHQHNISKATMPASTGVSGRNVAGAALTAAVWAVRPEDPEAELVRTVASPGQCPAPAYGSAFSRAVEITASGFRQLLISGTASIAPGGKTSHVGNVEAQINRTMEAVEGILAARHMSLADTSRATAYFKSAKEVAVFAKWLKQRGVKHLPLVNVCCDICRPDLLFELELDALHAGIP
jgi:enamine deaminase RidA (YjgF/YER057c/UK114 family)